MTVDSYITQKFESFGVKLSEADLFDIRGSLDGNGEVGEADRRALLVGVASFVPSLLTRATSVSESGFSVSWNIEGIRRYYSYLCSELGIKDKLNDKPKLTFY
jgi:hypothetical protein